VGFFLPGASRCAPDISYMTRTWLAPVWVCWFVRESSGYVSPLTGFVRYFKGEFSNTFRPTLGLLPGPFLSPGILVFFLPPPERSGLKPYVDPGFPWVDSRSYPGCYSVSCPPFLSFRPPPINRHFPTGPVQQARPLFFCLYLEKGAGPVPGPPRASHGLFGFNMFPPSRVRS